MAQNDLGGTLRGAREVSGLTLDAIARRTNIAPHVLEAIERNALDEIPGGLFARGYIRAYAGEVGLDGERLIEEYFERIESDERLIAHLRARYPGAPRRRKQIVQLVLVIVGLTCLLYLLMSDSRGADGGVHRDRDSAPPDASGVSSWRGSSQPLEAA